MLKLPLPSIPIHSATISGLIALMLSIPATAEQSRLFVPKDQISKIQVQRLAEKIRKNHRDTLPKAFARSSDELYSDRRQQFNICEVNPSLCEK